MEKTPLIIITGSTAAGKTDLSIRLAKAIDGEIISADSMQVYRHMDIGSAKVTKDEMEGVPHHLIDVLEPEEEFNVAVFQQMAKKALEEIYSRGNIPIVAGGTGFYIQALLYDIHFEDDTGEGPLRKELEELARQRGEAYLHEQLEKIDPVSARLIHPNNVKRVIRAIEYYRQTGEPISGHNERERKRLSPYHFLYYVMHMDRAVLYERINRRVDQMLEAGLVEEVRALKERGVRRGMTSMQGIGYKEILDYLDGVCTLEEAVYILKRDTRHFAKRQLTWFKRERDVRWLNPADFENDMDQMLEHILKECRQEGIVP